MPTLRWQPIVTMVLSLLGLGVSIYLTITHFDTHIALSCPAGGGLINCEKVTTSPQSYVFGIPVAVLGLAYFVPMLGLSLPWAWRSADRRIHLVRLALVVVGVGMAIYLVIAELLIIKNICLWCTSVHVISFILFVIVVTASPILLSRDDGLETDGSAQLAHRGS
ncbi:MAG TPA: vitamin K epoxide reductase family protein [Acidimicrobiales bacterium]|nr:vitamin K epoxide reductase family protein [Acidimicrobiales bacterium]